MGVPATFSLTVDLIPVRDRGYAAAAITAVAYFAAAAFPGSWQIEPFSRVMLLIMVPGVLALGSIVALAGSSHSFVAVWVAELAPNHKGARFGRGRFLRGGSGRIDRRFLGFVALIFAIFFVDSLGFLRIVDTPILVDGAWQAVVQTTIAALGTPMLYATAVSLYTVVNFALWADLSTPRTASNRYQSGEFIGL